MKKKHGIIPGFAVILMAAIFTFTACPNGGGDDNDHNPTIVGRWDYNNTSYILEFKSDGTWIMPTGVYSGTYKTNGSTLTFVEEGDSGTFVFSNNNNTLTISGFPTASGLNGIWNRI
jgi:hypothetical protein